MTRWQHSGPHLYWTRERLIEGLRDFIPTRRGPLPCNSDVYNTIKNGHEEWPQARRVLGEFGSMARGYLAAGAARARISLNNIEWTADEDEFLLENAGRLTLAAIARRLNRSYGAVRARLGKTHGKRARDVQCYLSAAQVAARFNVPYHRVQEFCRTGRLRAKKRLGNWQIDVRDCEKNSALRAPKTRSYKATPPDVGDYYRRYNIRRRRTGDGRIERYEATG